ncbi:major facilitator superfamily domain-containing protein, partial [Mycena maculata]
LAAAFLIEVIARGFPNVYGVFLDSYLQDPSQKATTLLPLVGTLASGIITCSGPIVNPISARYPHWFGAALCCGSLLAASYATKVVELVLIQGILYGIGGALLWLPCMQYISEWFVAVRRGTATGILFAGKCRGLLLSLVLPQLISRYGSANALRILSIAFAIVLFPLLPFAKGRLPLARVHIHGPAPRGTGSRDWMKQTPFWIYLTVNTLEGFAHFVPIVYIPTFANDLRISSANSAVTLVVLNGTGGVRGWSVHGTSLRKIQPMAISALLVASATTFTLWGVLAHTFSGLLAFGMVYGGVAGSWACLWTGFVRPPATFVIHVKNTTFSASLYIYLLSRGIASIVSTPISARLYAQPQNMTGGLSLENTGFEVGNGRFEKMIIYVGTCFAGAAGIAALGWAMDIRQICRSSGNSEKTPIMMIGTLAVLGRDI